MARPAAARVSSRSPAIDQRKKLSGATERLLCSQGLGGVTTRDIARAAKVAEGALYHHFHDKAELMLSVVLHQLGDFPEVLQSLPLQVGQNAVERNLGRVLESAFAFHHRIAPLGCSLFADQELLGRVRSMMHERSMGPARTTSVIAAYLHAEQQLGRVLAAAVPETVADLMLAVSFNTALRDHFFDGGSEWCARCGSAERGELRGRALGGPRTLAAAQAALRQAEENLNAQYAVLYPSVDASVGAKRQRITGASFGNPAIPSSVFNLYNASVNVSYAIDVAGGARRELEALQAGTGFQRVPLEGTSPSPTGDTAAPALPDAAPR